MFYERLLLYFFIILAAFLVVALMVFVPKADGDLPIKTSFPFDTTVMPGHEIAMFLGTAAVAYGLYSIVAMDSLAINLCRCINIQLITLGSNYEKCMVHVHNRCGLKTSVLKVNEPDQIIRGFISFQKGEEEVENDSFMKRFSLCKLHHQRVIDVIGEFNTIFGSSMLMQVFSSFSMICFAGFQALLVSSQ